MLKAKLKLLPTKPGCYLMKNKQGLIIYVGKANNLRNRVRSYFQNKQEGKTKVLVSNIYDFDYIVTNTEKDALILELNLIKKYSPKYNVIFKDDKTYPYIGLSNELYPRLTIVRNPNNYKAGKLFGPYPNVGAATKTVELLNRLYPLRKCKHLGKKLCLYYDLNECLGYCAKEIEPAIITKMTKEIISFLKGNANVTIRRLETEMATAAERLDYERAQVLKELLEAIKLTIKQQVVILNDNWDRDVFNYKADGEYIAIQVLHLRSGKLVARESSIFSLITNIKDTLTYYIYAFYDQYNLKPKEILVPALLDGLLLEELLGVRVITPKRGPKYKLLNLGAENAELALKTKGLRLKQKTKVASAVNQELRQLLKLKSLDRIEVFDNSHLFGSYSVSGMVVFVDGLPQPKAYRKYRINNKQDSDYYLMQEVIKRRYARVKQEKAELPDLIMVDGGLLQVKAALIVLKELGLTIPVCGLKKNKDHRLQELIYQERVITLKLNSALYHYLDRINQEVHRFTINYHKKIRSKGTFASILEEVPGIGPHRRRQLLKEYGSLAQIKKTPPTELAMLLPANVVTALLEHLKK